MHNTTVSGTRSDDLCYFIVNGKSVQISRNILIRIVVTWKVTLRYPAYVSLIRKIMTRIASKGKDFDRNGCNEQVDKFRRETFSQKAAKMSKDSQDRTYMTEYKKAQIFEFSKRSTYQLQQTQQLKVQLKFSEVKLERSTTEGANFLEAKVFSSIICIVIFLLLKGLLNLQVLSLT